MHGGQSDCAWRVAGWAEHDQHHRRRHGRRWARPEPYLHRDWAHPVPHPQRHCQTVGPRLPFRSRMHAYTNAYMSSRDLRLVRLPERPLVRDQHLAGPSRAGNRRGTLSGWVGGFAGCECGQGRAGRASGTERAAVCGAVDGLEGAVGPVLRLVRHRHQISQVLPAQWPPPFGDFPPPPVSQVLTSTPGA